MPGEIRKIGRDERQHELQQDLAAPGVTDAILMAVGTVVVQVSGTGTVEAVVERSTRDPKAANWAPAEDDTFSGDLADGISARTYQEPGAAYWRVRVTGLSGGGAIKISVMGSRL